MTDWTELKDLQAVAKAQADGWEIEDLWGDLWQHWSGNGWNARSTYRGRPKQPKKVTVTSECWRHKDGSIHFGQQPNVNWQRFPAGDITGEIDDV